MNFPSTESVAPGARRVFPVSLNRDWEIDSWPEGGNYEVTLKVRYSAGPSKAAAEARVWTGIIESKYYVTLEITPPKKQAAEKRIAAGDVK